MSVQTPALSPHAFSCSCTHELGKALGGPSLASPGVLLPTAKPRQEWALWYQSRPQGESLLPPVCSALRGGQHSWAGLSGEIPRMLLRCSCTKPGSCSFPPLQSGLPQLSPGTSSAMSLVRVLFCDSLWDHPSKQTTGN